MSSDSNINMKLLMVALILCLVFVGDGKFTLNCTQRKSQLNFQSVFHADKTCTKVIISAEHLLPSSQLKLRTLADATREDLAGKCSIN